MKTVAFFIVTLLLISSGLAQAEGVELIKEVFQEVEIKGPDGKIEKKKVLAEKVIPGTEVFYVITYRNNGEKPAEKVVITNPVPKELDFISASPEKSGADLDVSVDEGKVYDKLINLEVSGQDGKKRPARATDVTNVKWSLQSDIPSGTEGKVSFRARLK